MDIFDQITTESKEQPLGGDIFDRIAPVKKPPLQRLGEGLKKAGQFLAPLVSPIDMAVETKEEPVPWAPAPAPEPMPDLAVSHAPTLTPAEPKRLAEIGLAGEPRTFPSERSPREGLYEQEPLKIPLPALKKEFPYVTLKSQEVGLGRYYSWLRCMEGNDTGNKTNITRINNGTSL